VGKGVSFNVTRHGGASARGPGLRCVACQRPIFWGERCEGCKRELVKRRKRKPR
jgi:hypothetical protein